MARAAAGSRSGDRQAAQAVDVEPELHEGVRRGTRRAGQSTSTNVVAITAAMPSGTGTDAFAKAHPDAVLRRRHRRGTRGHVRRRLGDARRASGRRDLLDVPPARLRQHHPRRGDPVAAGHLLHGPRGPGRRRRRDAHGPLRHRLSARRAGDDRHGAEGRARRCSRLLRHRRAAPRGPFSIRYPRDAAPDVPAPPTVLDPVPYAHVGRAAPGRPTSRSSPSARWCGRRSPRPRRSPPKGINVTVVNCRFLKPYDEVTLAAILADHRHILVVEEGTVVNGFGAFMSSVIARHDSARSRVGARRARSRHPGGVARAAARRVRPRRRRHRRAGSRAARERGDRRVIRLGVVGHRGYTGLPAVLRTLRELAPALGLELSYEDELHEVARRQAARRSVARSTRCSRSAATARCCAARA